MTAAQQKILIIGAGFGGLFTALELAGAGEITLISDEDHFLFTPMLYEYLSGEVEEWHIAPNYKELLDERVNFVCGRVTRIIWLQKQSSWATPLKPSITTSLYSQLV